MNAPSSSSPASGSPAELLALAVEIAEEAGRLILGERPRRVEVAATKSSPTDIVTIMDTAAERLIRSRIRAARGEDGILGEEGGESPGESDTVWVIDPIDGTVNYLYGIPAFAVSIGVQVGGVPVAGVVHDPSRGESFTAVRGGGAHLAGHPIEVGQETDPNQALVGTGFAYDAETRRQQAAAVAELLPQVRDIRRIGSAALDLCSVACGRLDAFLERGLNPWDLCAGGLVAAEAGAQVAGLRGKPAGERLVVAANPGLFSALHDMLVTAGFDD